jgi:hypothetical protein
MKRQNILVLIPPNSEELECFGNFKKLCEIKNFPYHSLKMLPFPLFHEGFTIKKIPFQ